jgi:DNA-binding transcriptional LysR family regulator
MEKLADIGALQAFVAVADSGSFVEGARRVGLSRSAVGKSIARLEELLGVRLLHRTTRRIGLTADGQLFLPKAMQILTDLEEAQTEIQRAGAAPHGVLRITATEAYGRQVILPIVASFLERWPTVSAETQFTDRVIDIVEEGYDVAIRFGAPSVSSDLIMRVVARSSARLCASPDYLARRGTPESIDELANHQQLVSGSRHHQRTWILQTRAGSPVSVAIKPFLLSDNPSALRDAARSGLGIACLPRFLIEQDIEQGILRPVLAEYSTAEFPICVVYPTRRQLSPRVRHFIDWLVAQLR